MESFAFSLMLSGPVYINKCIENELLHLLICSLDTGCPPGLEDYSSVEDTSVFSLYGVTDQIKTLNKPVNTDKTI